ncbi:MAG: hypothetical protein A3G33_10845 [Omnitrophica bacterium RIFCSPLOWO2_12_FULL_44_17]|uniref:Calcineurin-like phosphoesterase domain-containing protein n=1 Tax=Candidatus Danuiimicrobium aquiferis TaxID=1801832 RepID=A0A1G1KRA4_9BACT|nr:MAG: hypothetical protein A3B72_03165 [Omnitrophica bacterium RIFCSPHIGHO2_02_FULL_45_28]OGW88661.1 MAG: hypothetical protein A3E74_06000 [Omnitrophica bacterium RIFCSPHIGHO2_12_FULL_44_12]OGW95466.1 MAG: hypothetical protein A3G33_10845 [Omnitrophica bacterium RIFCSPLOWO2_12_FULL_44_17]OGX03345.1 MAG: hypothetical protein A3J12_07485 [Omnitrophica bacterium RIFCSPLOWO2_02_FULL_44_11]
MTAFVMMKYSFIALAIAGFLVVLGSLLIKGRLNTIAKLFVAAIVIFVIFLADIFFLEPNWIEINHVHVSDKKLASVVGDTKIVQISDIHLTKGIGYREKEMIRKVNSVKPDIIVITGDLIDDLSQVEPAKQLIRELHATIAILGVPGNTDHIVMDAPAMQRAFADSGMDLLVNENRKIHLKNGKILWILGADNMAFGDASVDMAMAEASDYMPKILLAHSPQIFNKAVEKRINLALVGHTHGAQVGIPFLVHLSAYANRTPYVKGLFHKDRTYMYVNKGIGMKTLYIRFLCRPEIAVFQIKE